MTATNNDKASTTSIYSLNGGTASVISSIEHGNPFNIKLEPAGYQHSEENTFIIAENDKVVEKMVSAWSHVYALGTYDLAEHGLHTRGLNGIYQERAGAIHTGLYGGTDVVLTKHQREKNAWYSVSQINGRYIVAKRANDKQALLHDMIHMLSIGKAFMVKPAFYLSKLMNAIIEVWGVEDPDARQALYRSRTEAAALRREASFAVRKEMAMGEGVVDQEGVLTFVSLETGQEFQLDPQTCDASVLQAWSPGGRSLARIMLPTTSYSYLSALKHHSAKRTPVTVAERSVDF